MRWLALAFLPLLAAGCLGDSAVFALEGCPDPQLGLAVDNFDVLLPAGVWAGSRPHVTVEAVDGATLTAMAYWNATGVARIVFDGPDGRVVSSQQRFNTSAERVPAGSYSLSLEGDPAAFAGTYILALTSSSC